MVDPISLASMGAAAKAALEDLAKSKLGELVADWVNDTPTERLKAAREVDAREWQLQRIIAIDRRVSELQSGGQTTAAKLAEFEALLGNDQFWRLQYNYQIEAGREAMNERRRMLAFASAGSFNVELRLGQISRIERTVRELDPEDIVLLGEFGQQLAQGGGIKQGYSDHPSAEALMTAGCVRFAPVAGGSAPRDLTRLGRDMLAVMSGYITARRGEGPRPPT